MRFDLPTVSRRRFIQMTGGALGAACLPGLIGSGPASATTPAAMPAAASSAAEIPIGVQLYCFRHELAEDVPGTLAKIAGLGFEGVEFADYFGYSAEDLRKILDDNGVRCCGTHIYLDDMLGDKLEATVAFNKTLGNEYLIVRWLGDEMRASKDAFLHTIHLFNEAAENLKPHGMRVGYHNHDYIFKTFDGKMLWNILADETSDDVILQLDTGNASVVPGVDVVELIKRNQGRTVSMHVKPYSAANPDAFLGDDDLDWPEIFALSESVGGIEWYIVEYEREAFPPLEALKANLENMKKIRMG